MEESLDNGLSIKKNLIWNSVGNLIYLGTQWLFTYIVTILLGFAEAGVYALAVSVCSTFYTIASYSMRNYQASDIERRYTDSEYTASRIVTSIIALIGCGVTVLFNRYDLESASCIMVFMLFKLTEAVSDVYQGSIQLRSRMDYIGVSFAFRGIATLVTFIVLLVSTKSLVLALVGVTLASSFIVFLYDRNKAHGLAYNSSISLGNILSLLKACFPTAAYGLLFAAAGQLPRMAIESTAGTEALGFYSSIAMPVSIIQISASFLFAPFVTPLAESLEKGDTDSFFSIIWKVVLGMAAVALVGLLGVAICGDWFYGLLFGEKIAPYVSLAAPLAICSVLVALGWFLATVVTVMRDLNLLMGFSSIMFAVIAIGSTWSIQQYGLNGATTVYIIGLLIFCTGCTVSISRYARQKAK